MSPRRRCAALAFAAFVSLAPPSARAAPARWTLATEATFSHMATIAAFRDEQNGITGGMGGVMFFTHDGGKTWTQGQNESNCRWNLDMRPGSAFSVGNRGNVRFSADDGATWTPGAQLVAAQAVSFLDARRGAAADPYSLGLTADGGQCWTKLDRPAQAADIFAVSLSERDGAEELRVLDAQGAIWLSADGGKKWTQAATPVKGSIVSSADAPRAAMRFQGAEGIVAVILDEKGGERGHVFRTRDGGRTWSEEEVAGLVPGALNLSWDGRLLVVLQTVERKVRVYRAE